MDKDQVTNQPNEDLEQHSVSHTSHKKSAPAVKPGLVGIVLVVVVLAVVGIYAATRPDNSSNKPVAAVVEPANIAPAEVSITSTGFVPATIYVKVGQAVYWTNKDTSPHSVSSDPYPTDNDLASFNSGQAVDPTGSYSYIFAKAGAYTYHDNLNPSTMTGTVIVVK